MDCKKTFEIYFIFNPINLKGYVGVTCRGIINRFNEHCWAASHDCNFLISKAIRKYGKEIWNIYLLSSVDNEAQAFKLEREYITKMNTRNPNHGYNTSEGGEGSPGHVVPEKSRNRLREINLGNTYALGSVRSPETCKRLRERILPAVTLKARENMRKSSKHLKPSPKMREELSNIRSNWWKENPMKWITDGIKNQWVLSSLELPKGWRYGRTIDMKRKDNRWCSRETQV